MQQNLRLLGRVFIQARPLSIACRSTIARRTPSRISLLRAVPERTIHRPVFRARYNSSLVVPESEQKNKSAGDAPPPSYQLTFTCKPCGERSSHMVSKQGYHHGTVLITCPSCKNRHVIADHLKIFMDEKSTLEDILKRTSEGGDLSKLIKKGRLGMREGALVGNEGEEDIEFWDDGSQSSHVSARQDKQTKDGEV